MGEPAPVPRHEVELCVDCREHAVIAALREGQAAVRIRVEQLDAGDFMFRPRRCCAAPQQSCAVAVACRCCAAGAVLPIVCERKTLADLASSLLDKRLVEQKQRLMALTQGQARNIVYIIEHPTNPFSLDPAQPMAFSGVSAGALQTVITDLQLVHGVSVILTASPQETARFLARLAQRLADKPDRYADSCFFPPRPLDPAAAAVALGQPSQGEAGARAGRAGPAYAACVKVKKADNIDPQTCATLQLMVIPGVSVNVATAILEHFCARSLRELVCRLEAVGAPTAARVDDSPDARLARVAETIADIKGGAASKRRIGGKLAATVVRFLLADTRTLAVDQPPDP